MVKRKVAAAETVEVSMIEPDTVEAVTSEALPEKPTLKQQVQKLIDEAPNLEEVMKNPWTYSEWIGRLNTLMLQQ
jgi:hypothetical protein